MPITTRSMGQFENLLGSFIDHVVRGITDTMLAFVEVLTRKTSGQAGSLQRLTVWSNLLREFQRPSHSSILSFRDSFSTRQMDCKRTTSAKVLISKNCTQNQNIEGGKWPKPGS